MSGCKRGHTSGRYADGACKDCRKEATYRWREANSTKYVELSREANRRWWWANRERKLDKSRRWREANPEKYREIKRRWNDANPEKRQEHNRRWRATNPEKKRAKDRFRKAIKLGVLGTVSPFIETILWVRQLGYCNNKLCRADLSITGYHLDHIMPLNLRGKHEDSNLQLLCPFCNISKHAKHPNEWEGDIPLV